MNTLAEVLDLLDDVLALQGRSRQFSAQTPLLGALPELDSMAVTDLLAEMETRWGIIIHDGDIDGQAFETVGSLSAVIEARRQDAGRPG